MSLSALSDHALVVFNFLPSRTLHPLRLEDYGSTPYAMALAAMPALSATWHRHWSRQILRREGLLKSPVTDISLPGLTIAVMQPNTLAVLARRIGVVLCAPRLRYAISGEAVRALQAVLGADVLRLASQGRALHPGLPGAMFGDADEAARTVDQTGYAALCAAFENAAVEVARRFFLKLPPCLPASLIATCGGPRTRAQTSEENHAATVTLDSDTAMALAMALAADSTVQGPE